MGPGSTSLYRIGRALSNSIACKLIGFLTDCGATLLFLSFQALFLPLLSAS